MDSYSPLDTGQSAFTGWTRTHWEAVADSLLTAARRFSSPRHAKVGFPSAGPSGSAAQEATDQLEGFARTFLLAALRLAGNQGDQPGGNTAAPPTAEPRSAGGYAVGIVEWYSLALDAGTAPGSDERWPALMDHGQPTVEATAIVLGLHFSRPWLWDALPQRVRDNIATWLGGSRGSYGADNNHVMFSATIQAFLAATGYPHNAFEIEAALARIEDWYVGDGWYSDGAGRRFDHYNAWTFQLYPFVILDLLRGNLHSARESEGRRRLYRSRLADFVQGYQHLFGADGSPLLQGRSLTYRWGVVAPFWMAQLEGITAVSPGRTRRLASGVLRHFLDRGAAADGVLSLGWHGSHASILQSYNAPGSPHWASKGFLGLLLPADHPAWTAAEEPLPVEMGNTSVVLAGPRWHVCGSMADGVVRALNFGSDGHPQRDDGLYRRLAYSTATVPVLEPGLDGGLLRDNDIYLKAGNGTSRHRGLRGGVARYDGGSSTFALDAGGRDVVANYATTVLDEDAARQRSGSRSEGVRIEVRIARLTGVIGCEPVLSGYAISSDMPVETAVWAERPAMNEAAASPAAARVTGWRRTAPGGVPARLASAVALYRTDLTDAAPERPLHRAVAVHGQCRAGSGTALGEHSALPQLEFGPLPANTVHIAWLVCLGAEADTLARTAVDLALCWTDDGAQLQWRGTSRVLPWQRETPWAADALNQDVFRWH
ncbi:MAG: DUF2264 domain-containing protein [Actinomycetota bacterium]|nr:DUF2264 domain-containing protein [Actinomycetota bacterium]